MLSKIMLTVLIVFTIGCSHKQMIQISKDHIKQVENMEQMSRDFLKVWPFYSGLIHSYLGPRVNELPMKTVNAMTFLDWASTCDESELNRVMLGGVFGQILSVSAETVRKAIEIYAPEILPYFTALLLP